MHLLQDFPPSEMLTMDHIFPPPRRVVLVHNDNQFNNSNPRKTCSALLPARGTQ
ncbi:hypothetical protein Fmac_027045 [Flemingia macrophylla]|uniref:Uncharacterized protein n=1 Tax=Flemingia macrophylla TaxID=520843 RepID=A0ABD1LGQ4_9FABA